MSASQREDTPLEERVRELYRRLGIQPRPLPVPPEDAPAPPRPWCETGDDKDDAR